MSITENSKFILFLLLFLVCVSLCFSQSAEYPLIKKTYSSDMVYMQIQDSISQGYVAENSNKNYPDLYFCRIEAKAGEDLFAVAAHLSLPYDTIATLNGYSHNTTFAKKTILVVPSIAGIFVSTKLRNDFDLLLKPRLSDPKMNPLPVTVKINGKMLDFMFFPGQRFYQTERAFFLSTGFRMPVEGGIISSLFGMRQSPFDGHDQFHAGIDIASPFGTKVLASRNGKVIGLGHDNILGTRIIIEHGSGITSVYGHLSKTLVELNQNVLSGTVIGEVGSTGLSTGPHLHFEIRMNGQAKDPSSYVPGLKK